MVFCHCTGVSDSTVEQVIREGATCVEDVTARCGAGATCPPCREEIRERLLAACERPEASAA